MENYKRSNEIYKERINYTDKKWNELLKENGILLNAKDFCEKIVSYSIEKGSQDNISCVVIKL